MLYLLKRLFNKICRILDYLPILWQDEDWDFQYILPLLRKKVERIGKTIYNNKIIANYENVYQETRDFVKAIDNYENYLELYESIYGEIDKVKEKDKAKYYLDLYNFENERWEEIWDIIKLHGQTWWD